MQQRVLGIFRLASINRYIRQKESRVYLFSPSSRGTNYDLPDLSRTCASPLSVHRSLCDGGRSPAARRAFYRDKSLLRFRRYVYSTCRSRFPDDVTMTIPISGKHTKLDSKVAVCVYKLWFYIELCSFLHHENRLRCYDFEARRMMWNILDFTMLPSLIITSD